MHEEYDQKTITLNFEGFASLMIEYQQVYFKPNKFFNECIRRYVDDAGDNKYEHSKLHRMQNITPKLKKHIMIFKGYKPITVNVKLDPDTRVTLVHSRTNVIKLNNLMAHCVINYLRLLCSPSLMINGEYKAAWVKNTYRHQRKKYEYSLLYDTKVDQWYRLNQGERCYVVDRNDIYEYKERLI